MDATNTRRYTKSPTRHADYEWDAEVRGGLTALRAKFRSKRLRRTPPRGDIIGFSQRSRCKMLKFVATIDWQHAGDGVFVTLTWPTAAWPADKNTRMRCLWEFLRITEKHLGHKVSGLWRCEWKKRLSGKHRGEFLPHFHLILFGVRFIDKELVKKWWGKVCGVARGVTWIDRLDSREKHAVYIAKYAAKPTPLSVLDYVPYSRNVSGRHWGYYRLTDLPRHPSLYFENVPLATVIQLQALAQSQLPWYDAELDLGFTLFGKHGEQLADAALEIILDTMPWQE